MLFNIHVYTIENKNWDRGMNNCQKYFIENLQVNEVVELNYNFFNRKTAHNRNC
jgi:hypothetical protein